MGSVSFAQNKETGKTGAPAKDQKKGQQPKSATESKTSGKTEESKAGPKMKKDGTPDMRHKENKEAAKPTPKLKKDGTPDMRYKENKEAAKKNKEADAKKK